MKKMKKSLKLIIALVCVAVVAIAATVITIVVVNNNKRGKGNPSNSDYALTAEQKLLAEEVNKLASTMISDNKLHVVEFDNESYFLGDVDYFDKNVMWSFSLGYYSVDAFDESGEVVMLQDMLWVKGVIQSSFSSFKTIAASKNHFACLVSYQDGSSEIVVCSVEGGEPIVHKKYTVNPGESVITHNGNKFAVRVAEDYFAVLLKDSNGYYYEFYEFLSEYSGYEAFRYTETGVENASVSTIKSDFYVEGDVVVTYVDELGFALMSNDELVESWELEAGVIKQTKTIHDSAITGALLDSDKYVTYSYSLQTKDGSSEISLGAYNKISGVMYSGDKYFAVFMQKVNSSNALEEGGLAVYFDYNLNVIAKYEASSSASVISYVDGAKLLTADGIFTTKNQVELQKISSFSTLGMEFYRVLSNGNFLVMNSVDSLCVYNFKLEQVCATIFDTLTRTIDDNNYIFQKQSEYYLYNVKDNTVEKINYVNHSFFDETTLYIISVDNLYELYDGSTLLEDKITSIEETGTKSLTITTEDNKQISYCFVENPENVPVFAVSETEDEFANEANYGAALGAFDWYYPTDENLVGDAYVEPDWYDYEDVVLRGLTDPDTGTYTITARHCIEDGYYSKIKYHDYFEFCYNGQNSGNKSGYMPLRFYYRVYIENGRPKVEGIGLAHHFLQAGKDAGSYDANHYLNNQLYLKNGAFDNNQLIDTSYDAINGVGNLYYIYTSNLNEDDSGIQYDSSTSYAEVYGDSIRVTLRFTFKQYGSANIIFSGCEFGRSKITDSDVQWNSGGTADNTLPDSIYYNNLYYQTLVVGYLASSGTTLNSSVNFYSDIAEMSNSGDSTKNVTPISQYFMENQLPYMLTGATAENKFDQTIIQSNAVTQSQFTVTLSNKINYSSGYSPLYIGKDVALDITGGRLIGFTNFDSLEYTSISNVSLYDMDTRTYRDEKIVYRAHATGGGSYTDVIDYQYLTYDSEVDSYVLNHKNASELYHVGGGLNKYRYVYCIYEPMTFYVELDYNVGTLDDDDNHGIAGEIDYLRKYAGLSVGVESQADYTVYNELWTYNVAEESFAEYVNSDKYHPKDFTDNATRLGEGATDVTEIIAGSVHNGYGYQSVLGTTGHSFYATIDSTNYYFNISSSYSDNYKLLDTDGDGKIYLVASSNSSSISTSGSGGYYHSSTIDKANYEASGYFAGDLIVYLCIELNGGGLGIDNVYYMAKNLSGASTFETYSPIQSCPVDGELLSYINIAGDRYYIQRNYEGYTKSYEEYGTDVLYLTATRNIDVLRSGAGLQTDYGNMMLSSKDVYLSSSFSAGDGTIEICIKLGLGTDYIDRAYYFANNIHTRSGSYTGHYYYSGGSVLEDTATASTDYSVTEKFAFSYIDDVYFTADPTHTHFVFAGWKVDKGDVTTYENVNGDLGIFIPSYSGTYIQNINPVSGKYLAGSLDTYENLWSALFTTVANDGTITWKSASDIENSPVKLVAQWEPQLCSVEVTLWTQDASDQPYMGVIRNPDNTVTVDDVNYLIMGEISDKDNQPIFTVGGTSIDLKNNSTGVSVPDGKLDVVITFYYNSQKDYKSIYQDISGYYLIDSINSTGMKYKIAGWVYPKTDGYYSSIQGSNVKIAEFIGDTTKLAINAYYSESNYDIDLVLNPMGGALNTETKNFSGSNESVYNDEISFARYNIHVSNGLSALNKYYLNADSAISAVDTLGTLLTSGYTELALLDEQTKYQISLREGMFLVGNAFTITIEEATKKYFVKRLVFRDVTLIDDDGYFDKFTILFEYDHYSTTNNGWTVTVTSQTDASKTLDVDYDNNSGTINLSFGTGLNADGNKYNSAGNVFSIKNTVKGVIVEVASLSNPGAILYEEDGTNTNKLNGSSGFTLECVLEAYTLKNETVNVYEKTGDDAPSDETDPPSISYNKSIMISSQPLTNVEGKELEIDKPSFIWLGTQRYMFSSAWKGSALYPSGYYLIYTGDQQEAEEKPDYTYEYFITQPMVKDSSLYVYYDNTTGMIYYPTQTSLNVTQTTININDLEVDTRDLGYDSAYYYNINVSGVKYYLCSHVPMSQIQNNLLASGTVSNPTSFQEKYIEVVKLDPTSDTRNLTSKTEEKYNSITNYYEDGAEKFIIYVHDDVIEFKVNNGKTGLYPSFNNTRVIAIDPEQENVIFSASYSEAYEDTAYYELKYYISTLKIADKTLEFDKPTREFVFNTDYYSYKFLNLNHKTSAVGGSVISAATSGNVFSYLGVDYEIQDSYMWNFNNDDANRLGAEKYYLYLTRTATGFTRYFLIFDVEESDQLATSGNYVNIEIEFSRCLNQLQINVVEEDLYQDTIEDVMGGSGYRYHNIIKKSFNVSYRDNSDVTTGSYGFNDDYLSYNRTSYEYMRSLAPTADEKMGNRIFYESVDYTDGTDGFLPVLPDPAKTPNAIVNNKLSSVSNLGDTPTLSWGAITKFYPCDTNRLRFSATSGYIIKSFSISFGLSDTVSSASGETEFYKIISFELDESSFEGMSYLSLTGQYSYMSPEDASPLLKYKIVTDGGLGTHSNSQSIGFNLMPQILTGKTGLMYCAEKDNAWESKSETTYTLDEIFVLLSGLYGNIKIDMTTTSYSEYLIESGSEDVNPLIKDKDGVDVQSDGSGKAYKYLEAEADATEGKVIESVLTQKTYFDIYTQKQIDESNWEYDLLSTGVDPLLTHQDDPARTEAYSATAAYEGFSTGDMKAGGTPTSVQNYIGDKYKVQYYFEDDATSGIKQGTIRIIFCGTVSRIKGGLHFMATHDDYSVYFTNGKYYNQSGADVKNNAEEKNDAFCNLVDYSGRTAEDKIIDINTSLREVTDSAETIKFVNSGLIQVGTNAMGPILKMYESAYVLVDNIKYYLYLDYDISDFGYPYETESDGFTFKKHKSTYLLVTRENQIRGSLLLRSGNSAKYSKSYYKKGCTSFYIELDSLTTKEATFNYNVIDSETSEPLSYTNKLVYMSTGPLTFRYESLVTAGPSSSFDLLYDGYFDSDKAKYITTSVESNYKFFMSMTAVVNKIQVDTSAYLFDKQFAAFTYAGTSSYNNASLKYNFIDDDKLYLDTDGRDVYQLDNTQKTDSWFNDTVLTNMQFNSYMDKYDGAGAMTTNPKTWVNRSSTNPDASELTSMEVDGYNFNWTYYTIAGYKLQYIMVYLVDLEKYWIIDVKDVIKSTYNVVNNTVPDKQQTYASFISFNNTPSETVGKNFDFNFKLEFYNDINPLKNNNGDDIVGGTADIIEGTCYKFYPVIYENDDTTTTTFDRENATINKLKSVNIMSNNIKVAFVSYPYQYTVQYMNYKNAGDPSSSQTVEDVHWTDLTKQIVGTTGNPRAEGAVDDGEGARIQTITYDCLTKLSCTMSLNGYTFIGWGSYKYFDASAGKLTRYQARDADNKYPVTWNSSSSWYDPTPFFVQSQDSAGAYVSAYQSALNFYNYYTNRNGAIATGDPCSAFYVSNGYFVTDTGYKSGYDAQNYNFYGDYTEIFKHNISAQYDSSETANFSKIYLFALYKANVYTIKFDVNNEKGDAYYLSLEEKVLTNLAGATSPEDSDWLTTTFADDKFGIKTTKVIEASGVSSRVDRTYYAYITYDTNNWYYSENNGQSLLYAYKCENTFTDSGTPAYTSPYVITDIMKDGDLSRLSVDMFGYSWLGWYYKKATVVNEGSGNNSYHFLQSSYNPVVDGYSLPQLNYNFYYTLYYAGALVNVNSGTFTYNGQHKAVTKTLLKVRPSIQQNSFAIIALRSDIYQVNCAGSNYYVKFDGTSSTKGKYYRLYTSASCDEDYYVKGKSVYVYKEGYNTLLSKYQPSSIYFIDSTTNALDGYVYFYDYSISGTNNANNDYVVDPTTGWCGVQGFKYVSVADSLNNCYWKNNAQEFVYDRKFTTNIVFSYFDTSLSASAYNVTGSAGDGFYLNIDRANVSNVRYIKLFANWVNNEYKTKFEFLDNTSSFEKIGSSDVQNDGYYSEEDEDDNPTFFFNSTGAVGLHYYLFERVDESNRPYRIGYDFVGWTFNYIPLAGDATLRDIVYAPNSEIDLNYKLFTQYAVLNGLTRADGTYLTNPYESNIFITDGTRLSSTPGADWYLNANGEAEHLGDTEGTKNGHTTRYIYLFAVWRVQTFSFGVSLNIEKENLDNLYDKDSNFAIGLYNSALTYDESNKRYEASENKTTNYTGVSSKFYTYNTTADTPDSTNGYSAYPNYFNDIVANVYFEIEFDKPIDTAKLSFAGRTYTLKDLMMTSAGYYFLGLMYQQTYLNENSYFIQNTLKSVLELDSDTLTYIKHENAAGNVTYDKSDSGDVAVFNATMYAKMYRSFYDGDQIQSAEQQINTSNFDGNNYCGQSTNFGNFKFGGKIIYIKSEQVGTEYFLYGLYQNKKFYVVFYEYDGTAKDTISFDKTFMYYHDRDDNGNLLNTYILRYNSSTAQMYYVKDSYNSTGDVGKQIVQPNIQMQVYNTARNTYDFEGKNTVSISNTKIYNTREFTLFAHWEKKNITSTIVNGNNGEGYNGIDSASKNSDNSNPGLAGWYQISADSGDDRVRETTSIQEDNINLNHPFASTVDYTFLPYFNGRYMSEMKIEFDTLAEVNSGLTSRFTQVHNTLTIRFTFTSSTHALAISEVLWNGVNLTSSLDVDGSDPIEYKFRSIPELSIIDYFSMNYKSGDTELEKTTLQVYDYLHRKDGVTEQGRDNIHPIKLQLQNVLTSVKFTCKFSVQTYLVEVYNVIASAGQLLTEDGINYQTDFSTLEAMWNSSNKIVANRGAYGMPYVSSSNYNSVIASTISINTAMQTKSYNIPYYYFMDSTVAGAETLDGTQYIYNSTYYAYVNGTSGGRVSQKMDTLTNIATQVPSNYGAYYEKYPDKVKNMEHLWFTYKSTNDVVYLDAYDSSVPILKDTVIYGVFTAQDAAKIVKFYYWDNDLNKYVHYVNNENEYRSGTTDSKISGDFITQLPSPSIAPWYGSTDANEANKKFIGYAVIDEQVRKDIVAASINQHYRSQLFEQKTTYTKTEGDLASHLYYYNCEDYSKSGGGTIDKNPLVAPTDVFKYRITVDKYYAGKGNINGVERKILDAVRANITIRFDYDNDGVVEEVTIQKDLKMLNVNYQLTQEITYAIPLYEDIEFEFTSYSYDSITKTLTLTSLDSMVKSNVFEVSDKYTIFHDPKDARIAVMGKATPTLSDLDELTLQGSGAEEIEITSKFQTTFAEATRTYLKNDLETITDDEYYFGIKKFTVGSGSQWYIHLYYVDDAGKAFYKTSNYLKYSSSASKKWQDSDNALSNTSFEAMSPLEIELNTTYTGYYESAVKEIVAGLPSTPSVDQKIEAYNRKLVVYIMMQLLQSGYVDIYNNTTDYFYSMDYESDHNASNTDHENNNINEVIKAINHLVWQNDGNVAETVGNRVTNIFGLYRMAYSMAYQFVSTTGVNGGNLDGLAALYGKGEQCVTGENKNNLSYDSINTVMNGSFMDSYNIKPGDFLKDDKTKNGGVTVYDSIANVGRFSYVTAQNGDIAVNVSVSYTGPYPATSNFHNATIISGGASYYLYKNISPDDRTTFWNGDTVYLKIPKEGIASETTESAYNNSNYTEGADSIIIKITKTTPSAITATLTAYVHVSSDNSDANTQLAMYLYRGTSGSVTQISLIIPKMEISANQIVYKDTSGTAVAEGESGISMMIVKRGISLDRYYNDYEKYDRFQFGASSGLYEIDPFDPDSEYDDLFYGISSVQNYTDKAGSSGGKQIFRKQYLIDNWQTVGLTIYFVKTQYTIDVFGDNIYVFKTSYENAYTEADNLAAADADTAGTNAANSWASNDAHDRAMASSISDVDEEYSNDVAQETENYYNESDEFRKHVSLETYLSSITRKSDDYYYFDYYDDYLDDNYDSSTWDSKYEAAYDAKYEAVFDGHMNTAVQNHCTETFTYDVNTYSSSSKKGYLYFGGHRYCYFTKDYWYFRINNPDGDAMDETDVSSSSKFDIIDGYANLATCPNYEAGSNYWLRVATSTNSAPNKPNTTTGALSNSSSYIYTRYESYFTDDWKQYVPTPAS